MVGRAFQEARNIQAEQGQPAPPGPETGPVAPRGRPRRPGKKPSVLQPPVAGQKRGPRRAPTAREQAMQTTQTVADMRGQAARHRAGLDQMGATQEEVAGPRGPVERAAARTGRGRGVAGTLATQQAAADERAALEATGEAGGTVTEAPVTGPSLNEARRRRSRSGRMYRR